MTAGGSGSDNGGHGRDSSPGSIPPPDVQSSRLSIIQAPTAGMARALGRYELLIPIAEGGMASVWAARMKGNRGFQKIVAIKQMRPELSEDPNFETMFLDEAALVSQLKHPNLAEIFDLGEEDGQLYQVMEYVDGEPLNRLLRQRRGPLPIPLAVYIAKEVCAGLHIAHELSDDDGNLIGLVHRDVSLQNILVTYEGVTKVIDFGVAKAVSNLGKTNVGQVKGKVPYMSPEQAIGDAVDRRTDIFALGIVLYQLCTAKHPFRGDTELETMMHICDKKPVVPPRAIIAAIPPALDAVITKALEKDKTLRFSTMSEMLRALEASLPPGTQASSDDLAKFMQSLLGPRGEQRRVAIQEAGRLADVTAAEKAKVATLSPGSSRPPPSLPGPLSRPPTSNPSAPPSAPTRVTDTTPGGLQVAAAPAKRTWSSFLAGSSRNLLIALVMSVAGLGIGLGVVSVMSPDAGVPVSDVAILYPLLSGRRGVVGAGSKAVAAPAPPASSDSADAGAPDGGRDAGAPLKSTPSKPRPKTRPKPRFIH